MSSFATRSTFSTVMQCLQYYCKSYPYVSSWKQSVGVQQEWDLQLIVSTARMFCMRWSCLRKTRGLRQEWRALRKLQTFHHCKRSRGSPLNAAQLNLRKETSADDRNGKALRSFHPRLQQLHERWTWLLDFVNNIFANYQANIPEENTGKLPMPIRWTQRGISEVVWISKNDLGRVLRDWKANTVTGNWTHKAASC